jgi:class 3 adenylate cyclase/tetratricopeptide (TPR) repeat protein
VNCGNCGAPYESGSKFCVQCGSRLGLACANCGSPLKDGARFCGECGTPAAAAEGQPNRPTPAAAQSAPVSEPVAERKLVTVLFADLVDFTPFAEERDAEEVRETLSRYFELARDIVGRYGGTIEKFIGDAVMAVWGAPTVREGDPERAVRAALDLVAEIENVAPGISARAGVMTGEAVVTLGATDQGMVAGDLVNTASRLQSVAPSGVVLVGEATHRSATRAIAFEEAGEQLLKGKSAPVPAWRALRVVAERGGRNRAEGLEAPFVGRETELRLLKDMLHATSRERKARLVSVTGIAGIGKSRLAWEFLKYLDGVVETIRYHSGRSPAYGEGVTFWALGEMVRSRVKLVEGGDEEATRRKVVASVEEWVPDETERRFVEPALLALLGVGEPPPGGRDALFAAWRTFFERIAARDPVTMVFEDLHWADAGLLDFIDHLLEWSRDLPIYIVTLARPELLERRPNWGAGKRNFTAITLGPLDDEQMRQLLAGLVPGLPQKTANAIVARAEGIPLYAVELVRVLVNEGKLIEADGTYRPVGDLGDIAVPETLQGLISARLDALEATDRSLLQDAAVLGQSFSPAALATLSGLEPPDIETRLRGLVRREVLTYRVDPASPDRGQYAFVQALIREVAYNMLAKPERKSRHLAAARWLESLGEEELAGVLAAHYLSAFRSCPPGPEADALGVQARIALKAAGDRAAQLGSHEQALAFYDQAITVCSELGETIELLLRAAEVATAAGRHDEAESRARKALNFEQNGGQPRAIVSAAAVLARVLLNAYKATEALEVIEAWRDLLPDLAGEPAAIALHGQLARAYFFKEDDRRSVEVADHVLSAAEMTNNLPIITDTLITKGSSLSNLGRTYEGAGLIRTALSLAEANGFVDSYLRAATNLSGIEISHDPRRGLETARAAIARSRRLGWLTTPILAANLAEAAIICGEWDTAAIEIEAQLERTLDTVDWIQAKGTALSIAMLRGEASAAMLSELEEAAAGAEDQSSRLVLMTTNAYQNLLAGRLAEAYDDWLAYADASMLNAPEALAMATHVGLWLHDEDRSRRALERLDADSHHGPMIDTIRRGLHAGVLALNDRRAEAVPAFREVLATIREMGVQLHEVWTAIDMAALLGGDDADTRAAADRARALIDGWRANALAALLESALAGRLTQPATATQKAKLRAAGAAQQPASAGG